MLLKSLNLEFVNVVSSLVGLRLVELDFGQLELLGSVMVDPVALVSVDELFFEHNGDGLRYDFKLKVNIAWTRYDRLSAGNENLVHLLTNMDLVDSLRLLLDGYSNGNLVRTLEFEKVCLSTDQHVRYKGFHKNYECYTLFFKGSGWESLAS